jgi:hypothetical protein
VTFGWVDEVVVVQGVGSSIRHERGDVKAETVSDCMRRGIKTTYISAHLTRGPAIHWGKT